MATCYRHPNRETGVSCSNCGRPICTDCMTPTSVGMRCPECARQTTQVRTIRNLGSEPRVTFALIAISVILFLATGSFGISGGATSNSLFDHLALNYRVDSADQYYRLVTGGFLHAGLLHILFNMYLLYLLGTMLEPVLGSVRFTVLYFTALLCGSFGALVQTSFDTVGASGAIFGLMGAAAVELRSRGIDPLRSNIGALIVLNLVFSFVISNVSIGGHIGGLIGGVLAGLAFDVADRRGVRWAGYVACFVLSAIAVYAAIQVALPLHDHKI